MPLNERNRGSRQSKTWRLMLRTRTTATAIVPTALPSGTRTASEPRESRLWSGRNATRRISYREKSLGGGPFKRHLEVNPLITIGCLGSMDLIVSCHGGEGVMMRIILVLLLVSTGVFAEDGSGQIDLIGVWEMNISAWIDDKLEISTDNQYRAMLTFSDGSAVAEFERESIEYGWNWIEDDANPYRVVLVDSDGSEYLLVLRPLGDGRLLFMIGEPDYGIEVGVMSKSALTAVSDGQVDLVGAWVMRINATILLGDRRLEIITNEYHEVAFTFTDGSAEAMVEGEAIEYAWQRVEDEENSNRYALHHQAAGFRLDLVLIPINEGRCLFLFGDPSESYIVGILDRTED